MRIRKTILLILMILTLSALHSTLIDKMERCLWVQEIITRDHALEGIREMKLEPSLLEETPKNYELLTVQLLTGSTDTNKLQEERKLLRAGEAEAFSQNVTYVETLLKDLEVFPIPEDANKKYTVSYENSWEFSRTYGGDRVHEGCDIMADVNQRGIYPVVSVTDGVVEQKGWLKLGGWRIGIRSKSGAYFYYAHLSDYNPALEVGDVVSAGDWLGFMGDSGYSETEGTVGKFAVHLHFGMYFTDSEGAERSVNPYYILQYLDNKRFSYRYGK